MRDVLWWALVDPVLMQHSTFFHRLAEFFGTWSYVSIANGRPRTGLLRALYCTGLSVMSFYCH